MTAQPLPRCRLCCLCTQTATGCSGGSLEAGRADCTCSPGRLSGLVELEAYCGQVQHLRSRAPRRDHSHGLTLAFQRNTTYPC